MLDLHFSAEHEDGAMELSVAFQAGTFAGKSSAWFSNGQMREFVDGLSKYPLDPSSPPILAGGYWDREGKVIAQEHVYLAAMSEGGRGEVRLYLRLAVPRDESEVDGEVVFSSSVVSGATYLELGELAELLQRLTAGDISEGRIRLGVDA